MELEEGVRVLLFVEREGRVVCVGREETPREAMFAYLYQGMLGNCDFSGWNDESSADASFGRGFDAAYQDEAARLKRLGAVGLRNFFAKGQAVMDEGGWWLVVCQNAAAGRQIIAMHTGENTGCLDGSNPSGRVLASGGKA